MTAIVHVGNVLDILPTLESGSVNCVVTSPPYWGLRDYGTAQWEGGDAECDHKAPSRFDYALNPGLGPTGVQTQASNAASDQAAQYRSICAKCGAHRIDSQLGLEPAPEIYVANMVAVFREVRRVLRDDGTLWLVLGDSYNSAASNQNHPNANCSGHRDNKKRIAEDALGRRLQLPDPALKPKDLVGIPWRVAFALQADGWYLRSDIIWAKPNPMPESVTDRPTKAHEYVFLLTKQPRYWYDAEAIAEDSLTDPFTKAGCNFGGGKCDTTLTAQCNEPGRKWIHTATRNRRTVWTIATQPWPECHFATYPEKLVEPCVLAGCPAQVCSECGAPWERVVERTTASPGQRPGYTRDCTMRKDGERAGSFTDQKVTTLGWRPTCTHDDTTMGTVLDPFTGSGTTGAVACRLGRNFVGIELSPEYAEMAERRIAPHRDQMQLVVT